MITLIAGALLQMLSQWISDKRARRRELDARHDALRLKRYEMDREVLISLQDEARILYLACTEAMDLIVAGHEGAQPPEVEKMFWLAHTKVEVLINRAATEDVRQAGKELLERSIALKEGRGVSELEDRFDAYSKIQKTSGEALRRGLEQSDNSPRRRNLQSEN